MSVLPQFVLRDFAWGWRFESAEGDGEMLEFVRRLREWREAEERCQGRGEDIVLRIPVLRLCWLASPEFVVVEADRAEGLSAEFLMWQVHRAACSRSDGGHVFFEGLLRVPVEKMIDVTGVRVTD